MKKGMTLRQIQEWKPPKRTLTPDRAARCELIQAISLAVAEAFNIEDVQRLGLVVDEAMRKMEE